MASFFPSCTEHEEIEIGAAHLDADETSGASGDRLHVLVEKHRGHRNRQPSSSSPHPSPELLQNYKRCHISVGCVGTAPAETAREETAGRRVTPTPTEKNQTWKLFSGMYFERDCDEELQPALVEVYRFESGSAQYMRTAGAAPPGACERLSARATRAASLALGGVAAAAGAVLALPAALALAMQAAALRSVRGVAAGCVQNVSDYTLKPALAVTFNAALRPLLVFVQQVGGAVREAVRPLALAGAECVEPVVRVLGAVRLVEIRVSPRCACHATALDAL